MITDKRNILALIMLIFISFSAFSNASFEITPDIDTLIPESALVYMHISNPDKLMGNTDNFLAATGLAEKLDNMKIKDFLSLFLTMADMGDLMDSLNLSNPAGLAIFPSQDSYAANDDFEFMLLIPAHDPVDALKFFARQNEGDALWYEIYMNYIVLFSTEELMRKFPATKYNDLAPLDNFRDGSLSLYVDIDGLMDHFGVETSDLMAELINENSLRPGPGKRVLEGYLNIFNQMDKYFANISIDRNGITLKSRLNFSDKIGALLKTFHSGEGIKDWAGYLPEEGFMQSIYSFDARDRNRVMDGIYNYLFPAPINVTEIKEYKRYLDLVSDTLGPGGAFSINLTPSGNGTKNPETTLPFGFEISMVAELTDTETFIREFRKFYSDESLNKLMNGFIPDSDFNFSINMEEINSNELSPLFRMKYELEERKRKTGNQPNEIAEAGRFLSDLDFWYHMADDRLYFHLGPDGIAGIKKLKTANVEPKEWPENRTTTAPDDANIIWQYSLSDMLKSLEGLPGMELAALIGKSPVGITGYSMVKENTLYSESNIGMNDIKNLIRMVMTLGF